jgi:hypothetical protein
MANLKANHVPQVLRKNAWLHLWGVLRFPVPERPVFLLHLDEINEHVLRPKIEALMQSGRDSLVEGALLIEGSPLVERQLNDYAIL